jgi:hypothetical protein
VTGSRVEVDTSGLERALRGFAGDLERAAPAAGMTQAVAVADRLRVRIPVRTGRLRRSVAVVRHPDGGAVSYGAGLPYARYIDRRTGATAAATAGAGRDFHAECENVAAHEARKL